jgi:hypothetical protein
MGILREPKPEKLIMGILYSSEKDITDVLSVLSGKYGIIDIQSPEFPFSHTSYYSEEMGDGLKRKFISFDELVKVTDLADIKLYTNAMEEKFFYPGTDKRRVNIDPGLISEPKLVLASTKNFTHRIYIGKQIWAEVTLRYIGNSYTTLEWTYPDYANPEHIKIFNVMRERYREQLK